MLKFRYELWVDRGGTFTDVVLVDAESSTCRSIKVLSTDHAPVTALRALLGLSAGDPCPAVDMRIATTLGTNALLERRGVHVVVITDCGLGGMLQIRDQTRPSLFARRVAPYVPLTETVIEVDVSIDPGGVVRGELDAHRLVVDLKRARVAGAVAVAVALRFGPLAPSVERRIAEIAKATGYERVVVAHEVVAEPGYLPRLETAAVDAYLTPVLARYFETLSGELPGSRIRVLRSDGTLAPAEHFRGRDSVLSGPAGGLVAASRVVAMRGTAAALTLDMGGTSTDVSRVVSDPIASDEGYVAGLRVRAPTLCVHTIAAGGGSVCEVEEGRLVVGPGSVGAEPGPLCYGSPNARALALTDIALALGRVLPAHFPLPLTAQRSHEALARAAAAFPTSSRLSHPVALAQAFFDVSVSSMARALADVSIAAGHDPREHELIIYGGAAGQYACAVARTLGIRRLVVPKLSGVFSAFGVGIASLGAAREAPLANVLLAAATVREAQLLADGFRSEVLRDLVDGGAQASDCSTIQLISLRYRGTATSFKVALDETSTEQSLRAELEQRHQRLFGMTRPAAPVEIVALRASATASRPVPDASETRDETKHGTASLWCGDRFREVACLSRVALADLGPTMGPVIVLEAGGTIVVDEGFLVSIDATSAILVEDIATPPRMRLSVERDPVQLEVMGHLMASIAERMGHVLQKTAASPNIRDRLDFSCAVFDATGGLVANAPHIPVHLGAMGDAVRHILARHQHDLRSGDVFATNDPSAGGSHLPDITVVAPVFDAHGRLQLFVGNRGHHADIGGRVPGSMPAFSSRLFEEGVVIDGIRIMRDDEFDEAQLREVLEGAALPVRRIDDNLHDLLAQVASLRAGETQLREAFESYGTDVVVAYVGHLQASAEERVRHALSQLDLGPGRAWRDTLDDGTRIALRLERDATGTVVIDFSGTSGVHTGNANTPRAVVKSAVLYALRVLVDHAMPLNEGCLRAVELRIPPDSLLSPPPGVAVASGNVETSQRIVDVLLGAFGIAAASQGTMNNITIGNDRFAYYETLGGGAGATSTGAGRSAVHTHMTNSRMTDVEVIESCFPLRIVQTRIRRGSGGVGGFSGGDGMVREYELLEPATLSVISERRASGPPGLDGGSAGAPGLNFVDGILRPGRFEESLRVGARIRIETPGGGGYGAPLGLAVSCGSPDPHG